MKWLRILLALLISIGIFQTAFAEDINNTYKLYENLDDLKLTLYSIPFSIMTYMPVSKEDIVKQYTHKVILCDELKEADYLIREIDSLKFEKPVGRCSYINLRVYGVFEAKGKELLSFGLGLNPDNMMVNDQFFKKENVFFRLSLKYLPAEDLLNLSGNQE